VRRHADDPHGWTVIAALRYHSVSCSDRSAVKWRCLRLRRSTAGGLYDVWRRLMYSYGSACPCEADFIPSSFVVRCAAGEEHMARECYKRRLRTRWAITTEDDSSAGWRDQKSIDREALKWFRSTLGAGRRHRKRRLGTIASETARRRPSALFKRMKAACCRAGRLLPILGFSHRSD